MNRARKHGKAHSDTTKKMNVKRRHISHPLQDCDGASAIYIFCAFEVRGGRCSSKTTHEALERRIRARNLRMTRPRRRLIFCSQSHTTLSASERKRNDCNRLTVIRSLKPFAEAMVNRSPNLNSGLYPGVATTLAACASSS